MQSLGPDWWTFGATIFSGVITALATMAAIIYTNRKSNVQLKSARRKIRIGTETTISAKQICRFEANPITDASIRVIR